MRWGGDLGVRVLAIDPGLAFTGVCFGGDLSALEVGLIQTAHAEFPGARMLKLFIKLRELLEISAVRFDLAVVEWPPFMRGRPGQNQVYAAAGIAVVAAHGLTDRVDLVMPSSWKKVVCGNGNAHKDLVRKVVDERVVGHDRWLHQDVYDAVGLWLYGQSLLAKE